MAKVDISTVSYKGGAPIINDLLGGHLPLSFNNIPESISQIKSGNLRALGVTTATRSAALPDVPTIAESGVPGYDTAVWWGMLGPGGHACGPCGEDLQGLRCGAQFARGETAARQSWRRRRRHHASRIRQVHPGRIPKMGSDHQGGGNQRVLISS